MICLTHPETAASGICVHCGRGLCGVCEERSANGRIVCSAVCATASERFDHTVDTAVRSNRKAFFASAYMSYAAAAISGLAALFFLLVGLWPIALVLSSGMLMIPVGIYFHRNAPAEIGSGRREEQDGDPAGAETGGW